MLDDVKFTLKRHPVIGWGFVGLVSLLFIGTALNQLVSLLKLLGCL